MPLLERVKFASIFTSNLDEFFMIRVAGLHDQVDAGAHRSRGSTATRRPRRWPRSTSASSSCRAARAACVSGRLRPALADHGIRIIGWHDCTEPQQRELRARFRRQIFPVLTPLAVGLGRPFPYISNLSLSLAVLVNDPVSQAGTFARVKVPKEMLPRFLAVEGETTTFVTLEDIIANNLDALFPGMEIVDYGLFRVTRDADFEISDEADDLLEAVETELRRRRFGEVVSVEVEDGMNTRLRADLVEALEVQERDVLDVHGLLDLNDLWQTDQAAGLRRAARPAVDAGHPAAPAGPRRRAHRRLRRDARPRRARPPPLRLVLDVGRAVRRAGGGRPRRAGDQADRVPHVG